MTDDWPLAFVWLVVVAVVNGHFPIREGPFVEMFAFCVYELFLLAAEMLVVLRGCAPDAFCVGAVCKPLLRTFATAARASFTTC